MRMERGRGGIGDLEGGCGSLIYRCELTGYNYGRTLTGTRTYWVYLQACTYYLIPELQAYTDWLRLQAYTHNRLPWLQRYTYWLRAQAYIH